MGQPGSKPAPVMFDHLAARIPLGRIVTPEEIAEAFLFVASDDSSLMTGSGLFASSGRVQVYIEGRMSVALRTDQSGQ